MFAYDRWVGKEFDPCGVGRSYGSTALFRRFHLRLMTLFPCGERDFSVRLRLGRLLCGKALPFRSGKAITNLLRAAWKAEPSRRRGEEESGQAGPERRSLSAQRGGRAGWNTKICR
jgi:hypothetical protein